MTTSIIPSSFDHWLQLRAEDVTSTDVAALFNCSPYLTPFELWHRKKNKLVVAIEENERMKWGTRLQDAIASGIAIDQGDWAVSRFDEYLRDADRRMGSSLDFLIHINPLTPNGKTEILEIKNVDSLAFQQGWIVEGDSVEAPPHIELQVQHQLAVSGMKTAYIGALVGGNRVVLLRRDRNEKVIEAIYAKVAEFWRTIDANEEPTPDFEKDAAFIISTLQHAEPDKIFDAKGDVTLLALAKKYKEHQEAESAAKKSKEAIKAGILMVVKDAEKVVGDGWSISAGLIGPRKYTVDADGYRNFKLTWKKEKS